MSDFRISPSSHVANKLVDIDLPPSKSVVNRQLVVWAALGSQLPEMDDSAPSDIRAMHENLVKRAKGSTDPDTILYDARDAGTVFRFLTALLAFSPGMHTITGTNRMRERPVGPLVDALRAAGACIEYTDQAGFPPLHITGVEPGETNTFIFKQSASSQFISACLLLAPLFKHGISVQYPEGHLSGSYIDLTLNVLQKSGCRISMERSSGKITQYIRSGDQSGRNPESPEKDWSAAAYLLALAGLSPDLHLKLHGLHADSAQGDRISLELFREVGVTVMNTDDSYVFGSGEPIRDPGTIDFSGYPDLAPPYIVYCALKGIPFHGVGLEHLRLKESDRISALQINLRRIGLDLEGHSGTYRLSGKLMIDGIPTFDSFDDHRIAMAFALCGSQFPVVVRGAECVKKSFPHFWVQLEHAGLIIEKEKNNGIE